MQRVPQYTIEKYSYYKTSENGVEKFGRWLEEQEAMEWINVICAATSMEMVDKLHAEFECAMEKCFEWDKSQEIIRTGMDG